MPATIFAIGSSIGHDRYYKDTDFEMTPHFGAAEIEEMTASGLVSIQSHTYDMHQWPPFEASQPARNTILPFGDESQADYMAALTADAALQDEAFAAVGLPAPRMLAFPQGERQPISDVTLKQYGYRVTLTIDASRDNELVPGLPESLIDLGRLTVAGDTTDEMLLAYLTRGQTPREDR